MRRDGLWGPLGLGTLRETADRHECGCAPWVWVTQGKKHAEEDTFGDHSRGCCVCVRRDGGSRRAHREGLAGRRNSRAEGPPRSPRAAASGRSARGAGCGGFRAVAPLLEWKNAPEELPQPAPVSHNRETI